MAGSDDTGSAPVEFVLVGTLVTVLFAALIQLGLLLYVRNMATAEAAEGARYAANVGVTCVAAEERTRDRLRRVVPAAVREVTCIPPAPGDDAVAMSVRLAAPGVGWLWNANLTVRAHALTEGG